MDPFKRNPISGSWAVLLLTSMVACTSGQSVLIAAPTTSAAPPTPSSTMAEAASATPSPSASAAGPSGKIVFLRKDEGDATTYFSIRPDGTDLQELTPADPSLMRLSPDGTMAVEMFLEDGHFAKILRPDGTLLRTLDLPEPGIGLACLEWSPDSQRLACEGWGDTDPARIGLYTVRVSDGGDLRQLTSPADHHHDQEMQYTADGSHIWYVHAADAADAETQNEDGELWSVSVDGSDEHRLMPYQVGWSWALSPGGLSLATKNEGKLAIFDPTDLSRRPQLHRIPDGWLWDVSWSPDGARLAVMVSIDDPDNNIGTVAADGSDFRLLPTGTAPGQIDLIGWLP